jgi:hypothetical protein
MKYNQLVNGPLGFFGGYIVISPVTNQLVNPMHLSTGFNGFSKGNHKDFLGFNIKIMSSLGFHHQT